MSRSRIIQHNENSAATSSLCAPPGMTTTAQDGDGGTVGSPSAREEKKRGETSTDGIERKVLCFYQEKPSATSLDNKE